MAVVFEAPSNVQTLVHLTFLQWQGLATKGLLLHARLTALDSGLQLRMKVPYMDGDLDS